MPKRPPNSVASLDDFGRIQLSKTFYMRDFLHSEIANFHGVQNIPENPDLAIQAGTQLCEQLLEPLQDRFGRIAVRSGYRSPSVNTFGNEQQQAGKSGYSCSTNDTTAGCHIWDHLDKNGHMGATASIVVPSFAKLYNDGMSWTQLAWWIHDHLPYCRLFFFPKNAAFNIRWSEAPERKIQSYVPPRGYLTNPKMDNHKGDHSAKYAEMLRKL
ncbi:hypothetical protein F9L33_02740 [Amylibacter sp. SFDW26]|uniref:hypothetical protein n=1 Tax=Amylibacter sp. SFDW26 TaxID=2652722 RepID=UPI001261A294|nr:hypothetical protein [Amylibacter sp. SFDW26]KAB7615697.1 hypothetical protein F9L33_02740 [Amylibacter sp. SFDW26]